MIEAVDPVHGKKCSVQISYSRLQTVARRSMSHAGDAAYNVPAVLQRPRAVFEGLRSDEDEDARGAGWRCYCGIPTHSYRADGREAPPFEGQVFLVFVNHEGVAYNWRWERSDPGDRSLPIDYRDRFRKRLL